MANQPSGPQGPSQWVRGAVWAVGVGLGLVTLLFGALYNNERSVNAERHNRLSERITEVSRRKQQIGTRQDKLAREISVLSEHTSDHDESAKEWQNRIRELERHLRTLQSNPNARPDPWTGTEGRAEARRVDRLELTVSKFEFLIPVVIQTQEEVRKLKELNK